MSLRELAIPGFVPAGQPCSLQCSAASKGDYKISSNRSNLDPHLLQHGLLAKGKDRNMSFRDNGSLDQTLDDWIHKIYGDSKVVFDACSEINKFFMKVFFELKAVCFSVCRNCK